MSKESPYSLDTVNAKLNQIEAFSSEPRKDRVEEFRGHVRHLIEMLVWGEREGQSFVGHVFASRDIMQTLYNILIRTTSPVITSKVLEALILIVNNFEKPEQIATIFSNEKINDFMTFNYNFIEHDNVDFFVNFLKSLSNRLDKIPQEYLLSENFPEFPLLEKNLFFYNHPETMVRTTVRNIYLTVIKHPNPVFVEYLLSYPYSSYFVHYACFVRDFWLYIDREYILKDQAMLKSSLEDNVDELMYLHDLMNTPIDKLKIMLANAFLTYCVIPCILGSFTIMNKGTMSLNFAIFVLYQIISSVEDPAFSNCLIGLLLRPKIHTKFEAMMKSPPMDPAEYQFQWNKVVKPPTVNFNLIKYQFEHFILKKDENAAKAEKESTSIKPLCKVLGHSTYFAIKNEDVAEGLDPFSLYNATVSGSLSESELKYNMTKDVILSLFRSRDDNLVLLSSNLMRKIICRANEANLSATGLLDKSSPQSLLFNLIGFIHTLLSSESEFRLVTIKSLANLLRELTEKSKLTFDELPDRLKESTSSQAQSLIAQLKKMMGSNQMCNVLIKRYLYSLEDFSLTRGQEMPVKYHYLMLCSPADLANKSIPSDLKQVVNLADAVTRDLIATFALIEFRSLLRGNADLSFLRKMPAQQQHYQLGNKIQLEGIMLLPCLYFEGGSAKQVFVGFSDNNILLAEQIKDDFKFGKVIFIEDLLAVGLTKQDKRLLISSLETGRKVTPVFSDASMVNETVKLSETFTEEARRQTAKQLEEAFAEMDRVFA